MIPPQRTPSQLVDFQIRQATFSDLQQMTLVNIASYEGGVVNKYLFPKADLYPGDRVRTMRQIITRAFLAPNHLMRVLTPTHDPSRIIAYIDSTRMGNDSNAQAFITSRPLLARIGRFLLSTCVSVWFTISNRIWKDRSLSKEHFDIFNYSHEQDKSRYWDVNRYPLRENRWHVNSLVVDPAYQNRGIGRLLMGEVMELAREEQVPVGLSASPAGHRLYKKLGFYWLGDFFTRTHGDGIEGDPVGDENGGGGHLIFYPEGVESDIE